MHYAYSILSTELYSILLAADERRCSALSAVTVHLSLLWHSTSSYVFLFFKNIHNNIGRERCMLTSYVCAFGVHTNICQCILSGPSSSSNTSDFVLNKRIHITYTMSTMSVCIRVCTSAPHTIPYALCNRVFIFRIGNVYCLVKWRMNISAPRAYGWWWMGQRRRIVVIDIGHRCAPRLFSQSMIEKTNEQTKKCWEKKKKKKKKQNAGAHHTAQQSGSS